MDLQHCAANAHSYSYAELHWITNPDPDSDPDPALVVSGFRKKKSEGKNWFFLLITYYYTVGSVADPDPGSGAFLTPEPGSGKDFFSGSRISDPGSQPYIF